MVALEEADRSRDHMAKKEAHTYHPSVISYPWPFYGVRHNPHRVVHILQWDGSYVVARSRTPETGWSISIASSQRLRHYGPSTSWSWCWRVCTPNFYRVHQMILPPSTNPDRNPGGSKDRSRISPSISYYMSPGNKKMKPSNLIQVNNNLQKKMVERTYHKVLSTVVNKLLHIFLAVFTLHVRLHKKLHWAWLTSKSCSL